jgi:hypothetical protein
MTDLTPTQIESLIDYLNSYIDEEVLAEGYFDEFNPADYSGGNFDDAYALGEENGYTLLANDIKLKLRALLAA